MKKNISSLIIIIAIVAFVSQAFAYEKNLPIGSRAKLASEAIRQVEQVYGGVYANGNLQPIDGTSYYKFAYNSKTPMASEISAMVAKQNLSFRVANPTNDWLSYYMLCTASDGRTLFSGGSGFRLKWSEKGGGGWHVPQTALSFEPYLAYEIPIKRKGVIGARIVARDAGGNVNQYVYLQVSYNSDDCMGTILFRSEYAGTGGELVVTYIDPDSGNWDSVEVAYSLKDDGQEIATVGGSFSTKPSFHDIVTLTAPYAYMTNIPSNNHIGTAPLGELSVPTDMWIYFHADTSEGENADSVSILKLGEEGADWHSEPIPANGPPYVPLLIKKGVYHVEYGFPQLRPPQPYNYNYGGGGKG